MSDHQRSQELDLAELFARTLSRRQMLLATGAVTLAGVLAACQNSTTTAASVDTITAGVGTFGAQNADPFIAFQYGSDSYAILAAVTEPLAIRDLTGSLVPNLATSWTTSPDNLTWTFTLRSGVKMQDGSLFTAQDVKTAMDRSKMPDFSGSFGDPFFSAIANVTVIDDSHVSITTHQPYVTMLDDMPPPIPTAYYNKVGEQGYRSQPLGAGAFRFVSQVVNDSMTFQRFDDFWDKSRLPNFKTMILKLLPEEATRVSGLQTGALDIAHGLSALSVQQLSGAKGIRIIRVDNASLANIYMEDLGRFAAPGLPMQDLRVRQAMIYALDRQTIAKSLYKGFATVPANTCQPIMLGNDNSLTPYPYDPAKAKQLLAAAGQSNMSLTFNTKIGDSGIPDVADLGTAIVSYWEAVGIKVDYKPNEASVYNGLRHTHKMHGCRIVGLNLYAFHEPNFLGDGELLSTSDNAEDNDPILDALIKQIDQTVDITARTKLGTQFSQYIYNNLPTIAVVATPSLIAVGPHVGSWKLQASNAGCGPWWYLHAV
jgi:peptide/nickel transport system substrate-binding protein